MTVGELARGVELIRHRGNEPQAELLDSWLADFIEYFADDILVFDAEAAQVWEVTASVTTGTRN